MANKEVTAAPSDALTGVSFNGSKYGRQERIQAVTDYLIEGSISRASRASGIPESTLRDWRKEEWWGPLSAEVRA